MFKETQMSKHKAELDQVKTQGKELLQAFFAEKDQKRAALKVLLEQANPDEKKQLTALVRSQLKDKNANWKAEHADLIASFQSLSELVKNDEALLEQVMDNVRKLGPEGDEIFYEQLKSIQIIIKI